MDEEELREDESDRSAGDVAPDSFVEPAPVARNKHPKWQLPLLLFLATCASTYLVGGTAFAFALMTILLAHEFGHYFQARRYGVPATYPCFIPMPISPIGTMGAVIAMQPGKGDRRSLFDIAISGPIAGLLPAIGFSIYGLTQSQVQKHQHVQVDEPLRRPHRLRHEIALPKRVGMAGEECVPRILAVVGQWLESRFL